MAVLVGNVPVMMLPVIRASLILTISGAGENSPGTSLGKAVVTTWSCMATGWPVAAASLLRLSQYELELKE